MAPITSIYSSARSGMAVAQTAAALVSRNLANAQTPGYAREILPISAALGGLGVTSGAPLALRAALLERALQSALGRGSFHESQVAHLSIAEEAVNDLDGNGLGPSLENFRTAIAGLAANPSGSVERQALLQSASSLGAAFGATRKQLDSAALGVRQETVAVAGEISTLSEQIARIDQRVRSARPGEERNTYVAQRSTLVESLASLVDVDVRSAADGTLTVSTAGGRTLVDGGVANRMVVASGAPPKNQLTIGFERSDGTALPAIAGSEFGGKLGGLVAVHEDTLASALESLDQLAYEFVDAFNATHRAGFSVAGAPGGDFFHAMAAQENAAANVAVASGLTAADIAGATDPSLGSGDNTNLLALADIAGDTGSLPGGASVPATWRAISSSVSRALVNAKAGSEFELASRDQLANLLASETGVSIDEEMFNLTQAQTALEASSKMISQAQLMTDTVLSLVG